MKARSKKSKYTSPVAQHLIKKGLGSRMADFVIYTLLILLALIILIPFYNMLLISLASYKDIQNSGFYIWPKSIEFTNYKLAVLHPNFFNSAKVSFFVTIVGCAINMALTILGAYVLSRDEMPLRRTLFYIVLFTMFFGAGLIPWYLVVNPIFKNSIWAMIIPPAMNTFYLILMRSYFINIPKSLVESARIDGANDFIIMLRIIVPVSKPILATVGLFYAVDRWNEWFNALIFIQDTTKFPMQLILRRMVMDATQDLGNSMMNAMRDANVQINSRSLQMATVTLTTIPIMIVYPFLQKFFTSGIMLGAVKA